MKSIKTLFENTIPEIIWTLRPTERRERGDDLRALIRRFPYWREGRKRLAQECLAQEDISSAYAEALALRTLTPPNSALYAESSLLLGKCFLKSGNSESARQFLTEAERSRPNDWRIKEELAACHTLNGEKKAALETLQTIPPDSLSQEGKAALAWLSSGDHK